MPPTIRTGRQADLGYNKLFFVSGGSDTLDLTDSISDAQIDSSLETQTYSVYGTRNDKTVSTSLSYDLTINTLYYTASFEQFNTWLADGTNFWWLEIADVIGGVGEDRFTNKGTFSLGSYGIEGVTIGAAPTDNLIEAGLTVPPLGENYEGVAYPFEATAAGNLTLPGTVDALAAADRLWALITEVNGTSITLTATVGGSAGAALDVDETKADLYEVAKAAANTSGALTAALGGSPSGDGVKGYLLVGKDAVATS